MDASSIFEEGLGKEPANYTPLSPVTFLRRAAWVYPDKTAIVHGSRRISYRDFYARVRRFAAQLRARGIGAGDTVSILAPNVPCLLEAHYAVPMVGAMAMRAVRPSPARAARMSASMAVSPPHR